MTLRSYDDLLKRLDRIAALPTVNLQRLGSFEAAGRTYTMVMLELGTPGPGKHSVEVAAGIHGDEPAGVEAAVSFLERNARNDEFLSTFYGVVLPCCNPSGYELGTRENADGVDLNRQFATRHPPPEVELITRALEGRCFDLVFEMHEDIDAPGLYLYEIAESPDRHVGEKIIESVQAMGCPIDLREEIEGMKAKGGLIRRKSIRFRKTRLPQAIYTYRTCGGHVITLEPPASMLPFEERVKVEVTALTVALQSLLT
ncbi:MAG: M14 family metallocarboxypeptidase [Armatimonadetes bacterium]|nr:M14 family metallocarboxypeptidase [Armatimonadota bacterium]